MEIKQLRIGICHGDEAASSVWIAWSNGDDLYVGTRSLGGHCKVSLHASRECRFALDERYLDAMPRKIGTKQDRAPAIVMRPPTPDHGTVHALSLVFPSGGLMKRGPLSRGKAKKPMLWMEAAPKGQAIEFGFFYSKEKPLDLEERLSRIGTPIGAFELASGEYVSVIARVQPFDLGFLPSILAKAAVHPLSDKMSQLSPGETMPNLSAIVVNDPQVDGVLKVFEISGLEIARRVSRIT